MGTAAFLFFPLNSTKAATIIIIIIKKKQVNGKHNKKNITTSVD